MNPFSGFKHVFVPQGKRQGGADRAAAERESVDHVTRRPPALEAEEQQPRCAGALARLIGRRA
jgi:hypothetical protein